MQLNLSKLCLAISLISTSALVHGQTQTLKDSAQRAMENNPEVLAKWHNFQSTSSGREAAFGAYLPNVNLSANAGRDDRDNRLGKTELNRNSTSLSLNQMIYDGFLTRNQVKQLDHLKQVRFFEFQDTSEAIALEVTRAYADVTRFRKLVSLSEDNYVRHRAVFEQIQAKSKAGVGRRVDLEQISGRLALAEANLVTETSNLHDVNARFQRLVGVMPGKELESLHTLSKDLPVSAVAAMHTAFNQHPALLASVENIQAVNSTVGTRQSAYQPRFDFKARSEHGNNIDFVKGRTTNNTAEVVMTWNLFNGGSDKARVREAADQLNLARDLRDKTCRDIRQTLVIAFNDTRKLTDQLGFLDQHQLSIEKARDAYRQQFDIGQRSLLDLLDTENELFQAKRSFANAEIDLFLSFARTHASMGQLHHALGLSRRDTNGQQQRESEKESSEHCSIEAPDTYVINKAALDQRALEGLSQFEERKTPVKTPLPVAAPETKAPVVPVTAEAVSAPAIPVSVVAAARSTVLSALKGWREAWISMNSEAYFDFYSPKYTSRESWRAARRARLMTAQKISLDLSDIQFVMQDSKHATSTFQQSYRSALYQDTLQKTLYWEESKGKWHIVNEVVSGPNAKQW